MRLMFSGCDTV